jgi:hypothetical protein
MSGLMHHSVSGGERTGSRISRGSIFFSLVCCGLTLGCLGDKPRKVENVPDAPDLVVIVTVDSLRWDTLGAYGDSTGVSPAFDRIAERSHLFEHAYATSSWTKPSMASLLTSSIVSDHLVYLSTLEKEPVIAYLKDRFDADHDRVYLRGNVLPENLPLFHESLDGYQKAAFIDNVHLRRELGFARGWDSFIHYDSRKGEPGVPGNADAINRDILGFVDAHRGQKLLLWIHYFDVHWPYGPIEPYGEKFLGDSLGLLPDPYSYGTASEMVQGQHADDSVLASVVLPGIYRAGLRAFDDVLGDLVLQLEDRGLFDGSLFVVTSDHGDEFFEHGRFGHGHNLYDATVRIPLLIKLPRQESSSRHDGPVSIIDIGPTVLDVCGAQTDERLSGDSLLPLMANDISIQRTPVFELVNLELENMKGIVDGEHKLLVDIERDTATRRLFSLGDDRRQLDPTTFDHRSAELVSLLHTAVREWDPRLLLLEAVRVNDSAPEEIENVDEIIEQLRAIGYIQ